MKNIKFFSLLALLAVSLLSFTACSDDDDDVSSDDIENNILGTWQTTHVEGYWYDDTEEENIIEINHDVEEDEAERLKFNANGTCQYYTYVTSLDKWVSAGSDYTYTIIGSKIVISESDGMVWGTYNVLSLSSDRVVIEGMLEEGDSYKFRITLKRVD